MLSAHDLCDDRETCGFFCLEEKIKTMFMKSLECVRGSSRLESTAAEKSSAGAFHILSDLCDLFLRLDRTRSGNHLEIAAADLSAADIDHGVIRVHGAVCLFVRLADPADILNDALQAVNDPQQRKDFFSKSLNVYTNAMRAWFDIDEFRKSDAGYDWTVDQLAKLPIDWYGGADLSTT